VAKRNSKRRSAAGRTRAAAVMTGFELVHALRRDPELRQIPVIMLTARDSRRDMAQMRAAGASAYLVKPFSQDKCIALVERTLAERRLLAYKEASALFISEGTRAAAEDRATRGEALALRADERTVSVCSPTSSGSRRCRPRCRRRS
jgi:DNA-binding response OmpR family regulator